MFSLRNFVFRNKSYWHHVKYLFPFQWIPFKWVTLEVLDESVSTPKICEILGRSFSGFSPVWPSIMMIKMFLAEFWKIFHTFLMWTSSSYSAIHFFFDIIFPILKQFNVIRNEVQSRLIEFLANIFYSKNFQWLQVG